MEKKNNIILYCDYYEQLKPLTYEEKGKLLDAIFEYEITGNIPKLEGLAQLAFSFIKLHLDKHRTKYKEVCEKNKENINKRWNNKDTTEYDRIRTNTNHTNKNKNKNKNKNNIYTPENAKEVLNYFNSVCNRKYSLNESRKIIIQKRLKEGKTVEELKKAIYNFSKDDWLDRHKFCDLQYAIGTIRGIDNFEKWYNMPTKKDNKSKLQDAFDNMKEDL